MKQKKIIKVEKEEEVIEKAFCDFCNKEFDERTIECHGYGIIGCSFGFGSCFDDERFSLEICDNCFVKHFGKLFKKQLEERTFNFEDIKKYAKENNNIKQEVSNSSQE